MSIKLCFVKRFGRCPWKPLNWKQNVVAGPLMPEKERDSGAQPRTPPTPSQLPAHSALREQRRV